MNTALKIALREIRGGVKGFRIFIICLALGSMALAAISSTKTIDKCRIRSKSSGNFGW